MNNPKISVLMSSFNASEWIECAIKSVLTQTFKDFEFIIVDDGSTDETFNIVEKFCEIDKRIVLIKKEHTGLARSLNVGIKVAKGEWIARIDADDICKSNRLEKQFNFAATNREGLVFVGSNCMELNLESNYQIITKYPTSNNLLLEHLKTNRKFPPHSSAFFLKSAALSIGCYRSRFDRVQDKDLWLRMSELGRMTCLDEVLVIIRHHNQQMSNSPIAMHQSVFSYMATISFFIRKMNFFDPVDGPELEFTEFKKWLVYRLEFYGVVEQIKIREELNYSKIKILNKNSKFLFRKVFTSLILTDLLKILRARLFGSRLPHSLAKDWKQYKIKDLQLNKRG